MIIDLICATVVVSLFYSLAWFFGENIINWIRTAERGLTVAIIIAVAFVGAFFWIHHRRSKRMIAALDRIDQGLAPHDPEMTSAAGEATCEFVFERNYPPTINSAAEAEFARGVMASIVGEENVLVQEPTMGGEDFAYMLQAKPGAYCFIANGDGSHREMGHGAGPCMLHNPSYDFNDDLIPLGATYWVRLAEEWLAKGRA